MKVVTAETMQRLDRRTIEEVGIPGVVLMENAGRGVVRKVLCHYPHLLEGKTAIIAGKGNNGGDGFVIARCLANRGVKVKIFLLSSVEEVKGDARLNLDIARAMEIPLAEVRDRATWKDHLDEVRGCSLIVDAIFGTGLNSEVKGFLREVVSDLNQCEAPKVAVDLPSGLNATTGEVLGVCVKADLTVTFGLVKRGLVIYPGAECAGRLKIVDIGIPSYLVDEEASGEELLEFENICGFFKPRCFNTHKGSYGHVLVVAGSRGKTGAAALTSYAAARVGAGLVTLGIPESLNSIMEEKLTEVMTEPLPEGEPGFLDNRCFQDVKKLSQGKAVLAVGPGLSTGEGVAQLVRGIVEESAVPLVIDADGITVLRDRLEVLRRAKVDVVLTPHPGEMARLMGITTQEVQKDRIGYARTFAQQHLCYLVLKGARTIIATPDGVVFINPTGNPSMASGGMGDVLTGMIAGFIAQGYGFLTGIQMAVFLHGMAGDVVAQERGPVGILASDVLEVLPRIVGACLSTNLPSSLALDERYRMEISF